MKKHITLAAFLAAGTAFAGAEEVNLITSSPAQFTADLQSGTTNISLGGWDKESSKVLNIETEDITNHLADKTGWILGCGTKNNSLAEEDTFQNSASYDDENGAGFTLTGRPAYRGEYVALVLSIDSLLGVSDTELTAITLSFNATGASAGSFSVWSISDSTAEQLGKTLSLTEASSSLTISNLSLGSGDKLAFLFNTQGQDGGSVITVSNFKGSATVIPEPSAFGLLAGLGALTLVGMRRRRK